MLIRGDTDCSGPLPRPASRTPANARELPVLTSEERSKNKHGARFGIRIAIVRVLAPAAWAADNCTGTYSHVLLSSETVQVAEGFTISSFINQGSSSSADSVYDGTGSCAGYAMHTPDGKRTVAGACTRKNKDGRLWNFTWSYGPSGDRGTWQAVGLTGVLSGKKSSGWFERDMRGGKVSVGRWGGTCE